MKNLKNLHPSLPALSAMLLMVFAVPSYADVQKGIVATIGFWRSANGQAVINSFGYTSTPMTATAMTLGQWLNSNFGNLFRDCASETNAQVAAEFNTALSVPVLQRITYANALSVPVGCYASTIKLGFNSIAAQFGFIPNLGIPTVGDLGNQTYNVGKYGAAFGVPNGTTLTLFQVMKIADANYNPDTGLFYSGDATLTDDLNNVLNGIQQKGDIR